MLAVSQDARRMADVRARTPDQPFVIMKKLPQRLRGGNLR